MFGSAARDSVKRLSWSCLGGSAFCWVVVVVEEVDASAEKEGVGLEVVVGV